MNQGQKTSLIIGGILVAVLMIVILGSFWGWQGGSFGTMGRGMMGGFSTMFLMPILWIVVLGLIVWAVVAALQRPGEWGNAGQRADSPMDILKRRYAQGEIDKEEYDTKRKDLG